MLPRYQLLAAAIIALACAARAQQPASVSDQDVDRQASMIDAKLANRLERIQNNLTALESFQQDAVKERSDFERYMAQERTAFLTYLKSVHDTDRPKALEQFNDKQDKEREQFDDRQLLNQKKWFHQKIQQAWRSDSLELESSISPQEAAKQSAAAQTPDAEHAVKPSAELPPPSMGATDAAAPAPAPATKPRIHKKTKTKLKKKTASPAPAAAPTAAAPSAAPAAAPADAAPSPDAPAPPPPGN